MRMLSVVSINDMPAANSAGKTMIDQMGRPFDACEAEMPSSPISVAVSNPKPKRTPSGYICQLERIMAKIGTEDAGEETTAGKQQVEVFLDVWLALAHRVNAA